MFVYSEFTYKGFLTTQYLNLTHKYSITVFTMIQKVKRYLSSPAFI